MRGRTLLASVLASLCISSAAYAGPDSEVPSSFDPDHGFGAHITLDYDFSYRRSVIERETIDGSATPGQDPTELRREFVYSSQRHTIVPKIEIGVFHDVWIYAALPYVLADSRQLELDQQKSPCTFTGTQPDCVNRGNSSTIADGLLPMAGFDARDPVGFTDPSSALIFRGPDRSGVDQLWLGLGWAPMNQRRDDTKPTWKLGAELRLAVGKVAKLDRTMPSRESGVGQGVDEIRLWTTFARKRGWAEPYVELSWQAPIGHSKDSPFNDPGFGARRTDKQQEASVRAGFEAIAVDNQVDHERFSLDFSGIAAAHFEGRAYSEMWEVFAFAGDAAGGGPLVLDSDPTQAGAQAMSHPGVTNVENYLELGGRLSARAEIGSRVHLAAFGQFRGETQHIISFTDAGVDLPTCTPTMTTGCEDESNEVVNPGTAEVNPLHVPLIDLVGHRYRSVGAMTFDIGAELQILF